MSFETDNFNKVLEELTSFWFPSFVFDKEDSQQKLVEAERYHGGFLTQNEMKRQVKKLKRRVNSF